MVVELTITKINGHTRVEVGDVKQVVDAAVQINMCDLTTRETQPMSYIGWRISSMNQGLCQVYIRTKDPVT